MIENLQESFMLMYDNLGIVGKCFAIFMLFSMFVSGVHFLLSDIPKILKFIQNSIKAKRKKND